MSKAEHLSYIRDISEARRQGAEEMRAAIMERLHAVKDDMYRDDLQWACINCIESVRALPLPGDAEANTPPKE